MTFSSPFYKFSLLLIFNGKQDGNSAGNCFSIIENQVPQCDIGSTAETLIIHFERFEQLLSGGDTSPLHVRKHRKVSVARAPLATSWKQVSVETTKVLCEPIITSSKAKLASKATIALKETNSASGQHVNAAHEAIKAPYEPKTALQKQCGLKNSYSPLFIQFHMQLK